MSVTVLCSIASLFLPYLVKLNIRSGDLTLPKFYEGYHYGLTNLVLFIMTATIFSIALIHRQFVSIILSAIVLLLVWLVRKSIHFQGFIDHDFDSKTGAGFVLLFVTAIAHFLISLSAFILQIKNRESNATNSK